MKMKKPEPKVKPADYSEPAAVSEEILEQVNPNVTCQYGIHRGNFPVAGMKGKDARAVLKKLMKVDDKAAMVIGGEIFDEENIIGQNVTLVSFVKPSAVKGAVTYEAINIEGRSVAMNGKKLAVDKFCGLVAQHTVSGLAEEPIPDNVKWVVRAGKLETYIIELKPELRSIKWIADDSTIEYGSNAKYTQRKLATPYVILKVPFLGGKLQSLVEVFYRNLPLANINDDLCQPNLYNVSTGGISSIGTKNWFCTQYLNVSGLTGLSAILTEVLNHVWGGGFNKSSEHNEGESGFSLAKKRGIDKRVTDVNLWEKASIADPRFVLGVDWVEANTSPKKLIEKDLSRFSISTAPDTSKAIGNILLASSLMA